jgi:hypothetical protein
MDPIFLYFMDAFCVSITPGKGTQAYETLCGSNPGLPGDTRNTVADYLKTVMGFVALGYSPQEFEFFTGKHFFLALRTEDLTDTQTEQLCIIRQLVKYVYEDDIDAFMNTSNIWSDRIRDHVYYFIKELPATVRESYNMERYL